MRRLPIVLNVLLLSIALFSSCRSRTYEVKTHLNLPDNLKAMEYGNQISTESLSLIAPLKIIVLVNGGCSSCHSEIWLWENLVSKNDELKKVPIAFIIFGNNFNPSNRLMNSKRLQEFFFFRDIDSKILEENGIKPDKFFNSFLIDEENKIIIPGNPTTSNSMLANYKAAILEHTNPIH